MKKQITLKKHYENNVLIADFLGLAINQFGEYDVFSYADFLEQEDQHYYAAKDLPFNYDWNWLIWLCQEIEKRCGMDMHEWDVAISEALGSKNINHVYLTCIEFINWYNKIS